MGAATSEYYSKVCGLGPWTSTRVQRRPTQGMDECGFVRIKGGIHETNTDITYEPFVDLRVVSPIFYIPDFRKINHLMVVEAKRKIKNDSMG